MKQVRMKSCVDCGRLIWPNAKARCRICYLDTSRRTLADRFWELVDRTGGPDACWPWIGRTYRLYGRVSINGKWFQAHRVSWEMSHGVIPAGLGVLHHCDNPPCVNPDHLYAGTQAENIRDMHARNRRSIKRSAA